MIEALKQVHWSPENSTSSLLDDLQVEHGFCGVGVQHPQDINSLRQIHSSKVVEASSHPAKGDERPPGDALWTKVRGTTLGIRTADCLPVLFSNLDGSTVAAAHAGWRGLVGGVLQQTAAKFAGSEEGVRICIGPAISREAFEVGPEVIDAFYAAGFTGEEAGLIVAKGRGDRWHVDLFLAAVLQLTRLGFRPNHIEVIQSCTVSRAGALHSFRREGIGCGSNWAWIRAR